MSIRAYDRGFDDRLIGKRREDNPFAINEAEWTDWNSGWDDQDYHLRSRDEALASIGWFR